MKETLRPGLEGTFRYTVPESKTVPRIYPEAPDFQMMPAVFATGYMVALCEWACLELIKPHLHHLRQKLEPDPSAPRSLLTVRGKGYFLSPVGE